MGSLIDSCDGSAQDANVDVRLLQTPGYVDRFGVPYDQRQVFFSTRDICKGEEILYEYKYEEGAGMWYEGSDGVRNVMQALRIMQQRTIARGQQFPCKGTDHAPMGTLEGSSSRRTACVFCQPPARTSTADDRDRDGEAA